MIGGSYPGALVAWFKNVYPKHAAAAWSSSGVINPIENFRMFDTDIYLSTNKSSPECSKRIALLTADLERKYRFGTHAQKCTYYNMITGKIESDASKLPHVGDFMWYVSDIFTMGVQYGGRTAMCELLTNGTIYNKTTDLYNFYAFGAFALSEGVSIEDYERVSLSNTTLNTLNSSRQWTWQYCTEFGWFQEPSYLYATRS